MNLLRIIKKQLFERLCKLQRTHIRHENNIKTVVVKNSEPSPSQITKRYKNEKQKEKLTDGIRSSKIGSYSKDDFFSTKALSTKSID